MRATWLAAEPITALTAFCLRLQSPLSRVIRATRKMRVVASTPHSLWFDSVNDSWARDTVKLQYTERIRRLRASFSCPLTLPKYRHNVPDFKCHALDEPSSPNDYRPDLQTLTLHTTFCPPLAGIAPPQQQHGRSWPGLACLEVWHEEG